MRRARRPAVTWCWILAVLTVQVAVACLEGMESGRRALGDETLYQRAAIELLATGTTDLSPLWPPLYLFFLAALRWLGQGSWWLVPWVQGGLLWLSAWLLWRLARRLLGEVPEADLAPWLLLLYPPMVAFGHYFWPEVLHMALMLGLAVLLLEGRRGAVGMVVYGSILGATVACKALLTPWLPLLWMAVGWRRRDHGDEAPGPTVEGWRGRMTWRPMAWAGLGLAAVTLPLMAWNAQRVGVFVLSDSVAFNLWVGLEDTSDRSFVDPVAGREYRAFLASGEDFRGRQAVLWQKIRDKVAEEGIVSLMGGQLRRQARRLWHRDTYFSDQLPGGALADRGRGYTAAAPWMAALGRSLSYGLYSLILVLAILGWTVSVPSRRPWLWVVAGFLAYNLVLFLALHVKSRYRIQMMPWLILYATCGWTWCRCRLAGWALPDVLRPPRGRPWSPLWCWGVGAVATLTVLYLAWLP